MFFVLLVQAISDLMVGETCENIDNFGEDAIGGFLSGN
jgi:hypothetical protein